MSNLTQFLTNGFKPTSIVVSPFSHLNIGATAGFANGTVVLSGACTANTLKTILSVTGRGALSTLCVQTIDATSRTSRIKVTLDGVVIFDGTTAAVAATGYVATVLGGIPVGSSTGTPVGYPLTFETSLLIEYASSLTETDKARIQYTHFLR